MYGTFLLMLPIETLNGNLKLLVSIENYRRLSLAVITFMRVCSGCPSGIDVVPAFAHYVNFTICIYQPEAHPRRS
jgi:hypothetical protein